MRVREHSLLVLTGPTAGGKSALAICLAETLGGVIINADAMQMYGDLRVLTARPTEEEESRVPHRLYGVLAATDNASVARWLKLAVPEIRAAWAVGKQPILVGGTGLYVQALMEGLADIPAIPPEAREEARRLGIAALAAHDPVMDARLKPGDTQRRLRALEVMLATGKSLAEWQGIPHESPLPEAVFNVFKVDRPREELYARIDKRFVEMVERGAIDEVAALRSSARPPVRSSLYTAHGVPEITAYLTGALSLEAAVAQAQRHTRNYAKRQMTWLRNRLPGAVEARTAATVLLGENGKK